MGEAERGFAAAWWVVDELVRRGMEHACASPGSRSTPLALALARHPGVRLHVHLDERSSAFVALGISKATGRPVGVATTSGTAVANLSPAVVEASMSRAPLVLLTADRPPELRGVGANQTIDQVGIFGRYVRASVDAPVAAKAQEEARWRALVADLAAAAAGPPPRPVHLNLPFREPLVPERTALPASTEVVWDPPHPPRPDADLARALAAELAAVERGAILAGSLRSAPGPLGALADALGWPLLAEPTSGARTPGALAAGQHLIADEGFLADHLPALVLQVGAAPTSREGLELVRRVERLVIVDPDDVVADPHRRSERRLVVDAAALVEMLAAVAAPVGEGAWLTAWRAADVVARRTVDELLDSWRDPSEPRIARDVAASAPAGSVLFAGSSMPVRDLDAFMAPREGLRVLANRGASGIDGSASTALGIAASGASTTALIGDLALLHDAGALLWNARRGADAVLVVPNNDGGVIFSFLAQRELPELEPLFVTPHGLELGAVCAAAGAGHTLVTRAQDLVPAIEEARAAGGLQVVEVPIDRVRNVRRHREVRDAVSRALADELR
jgi:2-succinyl-5-enolpyruvyl-6-hydroxy-3-cyclohexene-1-carboxylate synthase